MRRLLLASAAVTAVLASSACATMNETSAETAAGTAAPMAEAAAAAEAAAPAPTPVVYKSPLLAEWTGAYGGVPPFNIAKPELFGPAFQEGIELQRAEITAIVNNPAPATFDNVFVPLQDAGRALDRAQTLFGVMTSNMNSPEYQAVDKEWSPKLQEANDEITFNEGLFRRIAAVHEGRESANLTPEQKRLVERTYRAYVRNGAQLNAAQKGQLGQINQQLASLFTEFGNRVLADENTWVVLDNQSDLAGLPPSVVASAKAAAEERKLPGKWAIVNTRSSVDPFLTFSTRRDLREKVWRAFVNRGDNAGANDTNQVIAQIVKLRADRAKLLGFDSHAHWRMDDTMAQDPKKAQDLMLRVWRPAVARVREEVRDMQQIANRERGKKITIEPWDYRYYAEKVRKAKYDLDQNEIKPYFELNNMIAASYWTAERLYGLTFKEITGQVPTFHPDIRVYEVTDKNTGKNLGLLYRDDFARAGKRSGAWQSTYRGHENFNGTETNVIASNNNNFVKGAPGEPVLISLDDAETLFHEFGHAIHALVSEAKYPSLAGTPRDYVEFPSQVLENWVLQRPVLDRFAKHYQTGQPMPQALVNKIEAASTFNQGFATVEYLGSALVDMDLHTRPDGVVDPDRFERETLTRIGMPKEIVMRHRLPQFNHLFTSDAYSAGYYSYLWSDTMAADAWAAFEESGDPFDQELARRMRQYILAPGNSYDRAEAFRQFRGRDPDVNALLKSRGFPTSGGGAAGGAR
jgi:peptidyl-dipeptidase Dcp